MHKDVRRDYLQSLGDLRKALPLLQQHCPEFGTGPYTLVNEESGAVANDLDMLGGFDAYQCWQRGMRGIAARAQRCSGSPFRTFTIRVGRISGADTEYRKRIHAIRYKTEGLMFPHWTLHAYLTMDGSAVTAIGLAKTEELYVWIYQREKAGFVFDRRTVEGATFIAPRWDDFKKSGGYFYEWSAVQQKIRTA